jgi:diaminopimelate epimerase
MKKVSFCKMQGSGNDFILIDNRRGVLKGKNLRQLARQVCDRHYSVGADGLIVIVPSAKADFKWRFLNADGSEAEMCGNGSRCAARFAQVRKIAGRNLSFETLAGIIRAEVKKTTVKVQLTGASGQRMNLRVPLAAGDREGHFINTGVPHLVYLSDRLDDEKVFGIGRETRFHDLFKPAGTNVNFVQVLGPGRIQIRTYERGVEAETLACGTGSVAGALIAGALGRVSSPVQVITRSGERLAVSFRFQAENVTDLFLEGGAELICEGNLFV